MLASGFERFRAQNRERRVNGSFYSFVSSFMWFLDVADTTEKLGTIRMLLCNMNCSDRLKSKHRDKVNRMIDDIQEMLETQKEREEQEAQEEHESEGGTTFLSAKNFKADISSQNANHSKFVVQENVNSLESQENQEIPTNVSTNPTPN